MGIPHPWSWDGISAGTGVGQPKTPCGTPMSITTCKQMQNRKSCIAADILGQVMSTFATPSFKSMDSKEIKKYVHATLREGGAAFFAKPTPDGKITDEIVRIVFHFFYVATFYMATRFLTAFSRLISSSRLFMTTCPLLGNQHCIPGSAR